MKGSWSVVGSAERDKKPRKKPLAKRVAVASPPVQNMTYIQNRLYEFLTTPHPRMMTAEDLLAIFIQNGSTEKTIQDVWKALDSEPLRSVVEERRVGKGKRLYVIKTK